MAVMINTTLLAVGFDHGIFTGSIARSASCWYLVYSEADFEGFHVAPIGVKFGMKEGTFGVEDGTKGPLLHRNLAWRRGPVPSSMPNFTPIGATTRV